MNIYTDFKAICGELEARSIDYALCGGLALAVHGYPRYTKDIDLLIREEDLPAILKVAAHYGYEFPAFPMTFQTGTPEEMLVQRVSKVDGDSHCVLDLIVVRPFLESVWTSRMYYESEGWRIQVVSRDGLIAMKRLANRPQDQVDITTLELEHG